MGRRALGKSDPRLDLTSHLVTAQRLPQLWDQEQLFPTSQPLEVEVGSGKGLFLYRQATASPQKNLLGIEISSKYARFSASRLARAGLTNARVVHADARQVFCEMLPDASLAAIHIYFPDPWWKKRHHKRRLLTAGFASQISRTLISGGFLHFWTDVAETYEAGLTVLNADNYLEGPYAVLSRDAEHDLDYQTHFERRMRLRGKDIYRAEFMRP